MELYGLKLGDVVECPHCRKTFEMNYFALDDYDDYEEYLTHVAVCEYLNKNKEVT